MIYICLFILLLLASLFAGLTLGYFSLSNQELEIKAKAGNVNAAKILPLKAKGNFLLCTLLLGTILSHSIINNIVSYLVNDSATNFSIFGFVINSVLIAVPIATFLIVIFAEILPNAVCAIYAMEIGAFSVPIIQFFMVVLYPVAKPLSLALDKWLGEHHLPNYYSKTEMELLLEEHANAHESDINTNETQIISGVLTYGDKTAYEVMTPTPELFMFECNEILSESIQEIVEKKFSRVPVYKEDKDTIIGFLYTKDLLGLDLTNKKVCDVVRKIVLNFREDDLLKDILAKMLVSKVHISFIYNEFGSMLGIVTLEDITETLINLEIRDEDDDHVDPRETAMEEATELFEKENDNV